MAAQRFSAGASDKTSHYHSQRPLFLQTVWKAKFWRWTAVKFAITWEITPIIFWNEESDSRARQQKEFKMPEGSGSPKQEDYIRRNIAGQKTKQAQSRRKLLARVKPLQQPTSSSTRVKFRFLPAERTSRYILTTRNLGVGHGDVPLVRSIAFEIQRGERWAILGANGSGKTTLLRTLIRTNEPHPPKVKSTGATRWMSVITTNNSRI